MLVGAYPFERPEDKHDNKKLQKMIQVSGCAVAPTCGDLAMLWSQFSRHEKWATDC